MSRKKDSIFWPMLLTVVVLIGMAIWCRNSADAWADDVGAMR